MTFLSNSQKGTLNSTVSSSQLNHNSGSSEDLIIHVKSSITQPSALSNSLKKKVNSEELIKVLNDTLIQKGEKPMSVQNWVGPNEFEVAKLSPIALHSFVLKAEQYGKKVVYEKTLSVKILD